MDFRNTSCSTESTLFLHDCHDQLQTTVFLSIFWLFDKRHVGVKITFKPFYGENNQKHYS